MWLYLEGVGRDISSSGLMPILRDAFSASSAPYISRTLDLDWWWWVL